MDGTRKIKKMKAELKDALKKYLISTVIMGSIATTVVFIKDTFTEGANVKFNKRVEIVIRSNQVKTYFDSIIDKRIERTIDNPMVWFDVLSSDFIGEYAGKRADEVKAEVEKKLIKMDSVQKSFIQQLGEGWGVRDDKVVDLFIDLGKKYIDGKLGTRVVRAEF
jgi:hypothetical protein